MRARSVVAPVSRSKQLVLAAGALVWRETADELEVLLVHRPRYQDWSFPKGKLDKRESLRSCAVREVAEETGIQIVLGPPLDTARYPLADGRRKEVRYWAAQELPAGHPARQARAAFKPASTKEIDGVEWMGVKEARARLSHPADRELLGQLVDLWEDSKLATRALVLVRHARAVKRPVWNRPKKRAVKEAQEREPTRPLTEQGVERARALVPVLAAYGVARVITSPWRRCLDTVEPYAQAAGLEAELQEQLTEQAHAAAPEAVGALLEELVDGAGQAVAVCLHRPSLPTVMEVVAEHAPGRLLRVVPDLDPWLKTGEVMVLHLARSARGRMRAVAIEKQRPVLPESR
ncbi:NUDIX hydrolase [Actinomyces bovis]|uniref:NUDIX hydrolase n=1 Tax=Actinomyces bovis TaxID=1658 RepID=UPI003898F945